MYRKTLLVRILELLFRQKQWQFTFTDCTRGEIIQLFAWDSEQAVQSQGYVSLSCAKWKSCRERIALIKTTETISCSVTLQI